MAVGIHARGIGARLVLAGNTGSLLEVPDYRRQILGTEERSKMLKLRWWLYGIAGLAIAGGIAWATLTVVGWRNDSLAYKTEHPRLIAFEAWQAKANAKVEKQQPVDEAARKQLAEDRARLALEQAEVNRKWNEIKALREQPHEDNASRPVFNADWLQCLAAAAGGNAADIAACSASGGDGTLTSSGSAERLQVPAGAREPAW